LEATAESFKGFLKRAVNSSPVAPDLVRAEVEREEERAVGRQEGRVRVRRLLPLGVRAAPGVLEDLGDAARELGGAVGPGAQRDHADRAAAVVGDVERAAAGVQQEVAR